jgi:thiol-disulfide isomerase/thioredoxin
MAMLCPILSAFSQTEASIKSLAIGDTVPDMQLGSIINYHKASAKLSDFKGKLLILDFWATWCSPCVKSLPEYQDLQQTFDKNIQFLLSSSEKGETVAKFLKARNIQLPSLVENRVLNKVFPHNSVPHEIWIKDGKVLAITQPNEVTAENIKKILAGENIQLPEKKDNLDYDITKPLLTDGNGGNGTNLLFHSVLTNYLDGVGGGGGVLTDSLGRFKIRAINANVLRLYQTATQQNNLLLSHDNRSIIEAKERHQFIYTEAPEFNPSIRSRFYSYELIVPVSEKQKAGDFMLSDLNRFFGSLYKISAAVEKRKVLCWVLTKENQLSTISTKGGIPVVRDENDVVYWKNQPFDDFFYALAYLNRKQPYPFINKTGITNSIDLSLPLKTKDVRTIKSHLRKYGLLLSKEVCEIDMLIVRNID